MNNEQRAAWLNERRKYLCGSDMPIVMSKWLPEIHTWGKDWYRLYYDKKGMIADDEQTEQQRIGSGLERAIVALWAEERKAKEVTNLNDVLLPSSEIDWIAGSLDAWAIDSDGVKIGVEAKNVGGFARWWQDKEELPLHIYIQCQWYLMVTGYERWEVAALFGGSTLCIYIVKPDFWAQIALLHAGAEFWRHVIEDDPPAPVTLESAKADVEDSEKQPIRWTNAEEEEAADALFDAVDAMQAAESALEIAQARMITLIGGSDGIEGPGWIVTYKADKRGRRSLRPTKK